MELNRVLDVMAEGILDLDKSRIPHKEFKPGVGPYGEPQLFRSIVAYISHTYPDEFSGIRTAKQPDILIPGSWAIECKIVRPFGDNDAIAEHWSQNLLHPYPGNTSSIGDIYKLMDLPSEERKAVVVVTYSHATPKIDIDVIVRIFELIAGKGLSLPLSDRLTKNIPVLDHPVHQQSVLYGWEVMKQ